MSNREYPTSKCARGANGNAEGAGIRVTRTVGHWVLDVGCWVFDPAALRRCLAVHLQHSLAILLILGVCLSSGCARIRPPRGSRPVEETLLTTGYCKCGKCCGWKRNWFFRPVVASGPNRGARKQVGITASGARAHRGTIAADTGLYPFGTIMYIDGYGYGRVEDRGAAIKGKHIDLFFGSHREALEWGRRRKRVRIWRAR